MAKNDHAFFEEKVDFPYTNKNDHFRPKPKAIGLPKWPNMVIFRPKPKAMQPFRTPTKVAKNGHFGPKELPKAIRLVYKDWPTGNQQRLLFSLVHSFEKEMLTKIYIRIFTFD